MKAIPYFNLLLISVLGIYSCKKEFDIPPVKPAETLNKINIASIKAKYAANINYRFKSDSSLYCVITADETSGNLFKELYVKDATGALHIKLVNSGGLFVGDSIRINLKDIILNENNKLIQLDSVDTEKSIIKLASGYEPKPLLVTLEQINANAAATNSIQSKLVQLDNVEFITADQKQPLADATGKSTLTRVLRSCSGQTIIVRTSGYCSFAGKLTPDRNGSITGILSQYGPTMQLLLRNYNEINMTHTLCSVNTPTIAGTAYLTKNFNDNSLSSGGWNSYTVTNTLVNWTVTSFSTTSTPFAKISGFSGGANTLAEAWYISPAIDLAAAINPVLSFQTAAKYTGIALDVLISVNYTSGDPALATWLSLAPGFTLSPTTGNYIWTSSGNILLSQYKSSDTRIAFRYKSTAAGATTYELDDIVVKEN